MKTNQIVVMLLGLLLCFNQSNAQQFVIEIKPGPGQNKDAYLNTVNDTAQSTVQSNIASTWTYYGEPGIGRSFIQFALPQIPENASNLTASLNLYHDYSSFHLGHSGDNEGKIERIIESWSLNTLNWQNQPDVSSNNVVYLPTSGASDQNYTGINLTELVLDCYNQSEDSIGLRLSLVTEELYRSLVFASGDHPDENIRPSLIISYDTCIQLVETFSYEKSGLQCQFYYDDNNVSDIVWDFGNGYGSFVQNPYYVFPEEGTYLVCMHASNSCDTVTICQEITVCNIPIADFDYVIEGSNVLFTNLTEPEGDSYYWEFGNDYFSIVTNPEFEYENIGTYEVCLTSYNTCGESTTYCELITISELLSKIRNNEIESYKIFPNPASDIISIEPLEEVAYRAEVYNSSGILVDSFDTEIGILTVSISNYTSGYYIVKLVSDKGMIIKKFLKS
ncbi:MAG: DNRLRE domain-containing protein [Bacteroidales bacterium]|nr:DNRLRE domain-containing protein [Bacteroidales bacterium]